jgi:hypothetical protein
MAGFLKDQFNRVVVGMAAGALAYLGVYLAADLAADLIVSRTITNPVQFIELVNRELGNLDYSPAKAEFVLSTDDISVLLRKADGTYELTLGGDDANVVQLRKKLYQMKTGYADNDPLRLSDFVYIPNAIYYGITGRLPFDF